jgi:hypothetical protein
MTHLTLLAVWTAALVGYFAPWIARRPMSAALSWNAYDLYALLRLLPEIESGALTVNLQTLQLPLLGLAVMLPLLAAHAPLPTSPRLRVPLYRLGAALLGCGLAAMTLPPYPQILTAWRTPGWRVPFWWGIGVMLCCLAALWVAPGRRYHDWWMVGCAELALLPALATLTRLLPAISRLHAARVTPGWGFYLCAFGLLVLCTWSALSILREAR